MLQWDLYRMQLSLGNWTMAPGGYVPGTVPRHGLDLGWAATVPAVLHTVDPLNVPRLRRTREDVGDDKAALQSSPISRGYNLRTSFQATVLYLCFTVALLWRAVLVAALHTFFKKLKNTAW